MYKALVDIRDRFAIYVDGGPDLKAHGNIADHEYEIERDGDPIARISKRWFRARGSHGVEIDAGEDEALLLAAAVVLESLTDQADPLTARQQPSASLMTRRGDSSRRQRPYELLFILSPVDERALGVCGARGDIRDKTGSTSRNSSPHRTMWSRL
jgi:hypothetical protein